MPQRRRSTIRLGNIVLRWLGDGGDRHGEIWLRIAA
jgi:hypothetical protein